MRIFCMSVKKSIGYICHIVLLLLIASTLFLIISIKINADASASTEPYFDPVSFKEISAEDLQKRLGNPDSVNRWQYEISQSDDGKINYCDMISYHYDTKEFIYLVEDDQPTTLVRIHIEDNIPYVEETLLDLFNLSDDYTNTEILENTATVFRARNVGKGTEGVYDFWIKNRNANYLKEINITFYNGLFTDL